MSMFRLAALLGLTLSVPSFAAGQEPAPPMPASGTDFDGPAAPVAPAVISRDASGRATVRATRIATPLRIDGRLDEAVYRDVLPLSDFIQNDPKEGAPASEKTEVWLFFDDDNVYVVGRCWETQPERISANEMRRDHFNIVQNDQFAWSFDTFHDRRNAILFEVSAAGGRIDGQVTDERQFGADWNPIWSVKTAYFDGGYVVEAAIPFKSIRYAQGKTQVWGFQARRHNLWRNEYSYITPIPASVGSVGHFRASLAATLVGIEAPVGLKNIDVKPFVTANVTTDRSASPAVSNVTGGDIGVDVKYGVTQSLAADFTVNTDFAQVEADEQQVNLTRFSLFFPEKREFFLENAGTFSFGASTTTARAAGDAPLIFYSRNIGLSNGVEVPIRAGGRLSGRAGPFSIGVLSVQSGQEAGSGARSTNFTVLRMKRDISRRNSVGAIFTNRSVSESGPGANRVYGVDANFAVGADLAMSTYWARSETDGVTSDRDSYRGFLDYNADRYGVQLDHLLVGPNFDPQIGFARRHDMRKNLAMFRFSPRPANNVRIRKYSMSGTFSNIANTGGRLESRSLEGDFEIQLQNTDKFSLGVTDNYEFLPVPFRIASGVTLPVGGYDFRSGRVGYNFGRQRNLSGNISFDYGTFYNGHKTTFALSSGRVNFGPQLSVEPSVSINKVDVLQGEFTTRLLASRVTYTMTPWMFASALIQYNSGSRSLAANVRFRWEYQPGSELFVVFNETGDTLAPGFPDLVNRSFIVKINRVFRF